MLFSPPVELFFSLPGDPQSMKLGEDRATVMMMHYLDRYRDNAGAGDNIRCDNKQCHCN